MALRLASKETTRLDLGDDAFVEVASDISKRDWNRLVAAMPANIEEAGLTPAQGTEFQKELFGIFVHSWSLDVPATVESYLDLDTDSAQAVDAAIMEHFNGITVKPEEEKKQRNSRGR